MIEVSFTVGVADRNTEEWFSNLDVRGQLFAGDLKPVAEGEFEEVVENAGGDVLQADELLRGLSHARLRQRSEVAAAL